MLLGYNWILINGEQTITGLIVRNCACGGKELLSNRSQGQEVE